jgi:pantetheine-phosphate adenylyltransferase
MDVIFPGSFDPLTNGHNDIVLRAIKIFDHLTIAVVANPSKKTVFTLQERVAIIKDTYQDYTQKIRVEGFQGLLVDFIRLKKCRVIIRGLRAVSDYEYETQMALINRNLAEEIETFFLMAREDCSFISSSIVNQVASLQGDVSKLVPKAVNDALIKKYSKD